MKHILLNNLGSKYSLVVRFGQLLWYYKKKIIIKNLHEQCDLETSFKTLPKILRGNKSEEVHLLILTNFDSFVITHLIEVGCFKNIIFQ